MLELHQPNAALQAAALLLDQRAELKWGGVRESDSRILLHKQRCCHYTNAANHLEPTVGNDPTTLGLRNQCSTAELRRQMVGAVGAAPTTSCL